MGATGSVTVLRRAHYRRFATTASIALCFLTFAPAASAGPTGVAAATAGGPAAAKPTPRRRAAKPARGPETPHCTQPEAALEEPASPDELRQRGHCEEVDGHLLAALDLYETALRRQPHAMLATQLRARIGALIPRLGALRVDASAWPAGSRIRVGTRVTEPADGVRPGGDRQWVDPGRVAITVEALGFNADRQVVDVAMGEEKAVRLPAPTPIEPSAPPPSASPPGSPAVVSQPAPGPRHDVDGPAGLRPLGYVGLGVGGTALLIGAVTGYMAIERGRVVRAECPTPSRCSASGAAAAHAGASFSTASTITVIGGAIVTLAAVTLMYLGAPKSKPVTVAGYLLGGG